MSFSQSPPGHGRTSQAVAFRGDFAAGLPRHAGNRGGPKVDRNAIGSQQDGFMKRNYDMYFTKNVIY